MTAALSSLDVYGEALGTAGDCQLRRDDGSVVILDHHLRRWHGDPDAVDRSLLARCVGAVLDVGCGPGRLVTALHLDGRRALGVDISAAAVRIARRSGAQVSRSSVFATLPDEGHWDTLLLADGNIGIGGDPAALLRRCRELLTPGGRVLAELDAPGSGGSTVLLRLESASGVGDWFSWAHVAVDAVDVPAAAAGLTVVDRWVEGDRWFAALQA